MVKGLKVNKYTLYFIFGLAAGIACLSLSIFLKLAINGLLLPEIAAQSLISTTSGEIESQAVLTLGPLAKYSTFFGATVINILIFGIFGIFIGKFLQKVSSPNFAHRLILATVIPYAIQIILVIVFMMVTTVPGQSISVPSLQSITFFLFPNIVYGLIFAFLYGNKKDNENKKSTVKGIAASSFDPKQRDKSSGLDGIDHAKRDAIRALVISIVALPLVYLGFNRLISGADQQSIQSTSRTLNEPIRQFLQSRSKPPGFENPMLTPLVDAEVTPTYLFYRIDINTIVPVIDAINWNLSIKGLVNNPVVMDYEGIKNMNAVEEFATLACISNKIGGNLTSTALWKGVRLRDLLQKAGIKSNARYIVFRCQDGYDVGIPLESGMMEGTILAYDMNNSPLTNEHGYPIRAIVPGFYGMMNPKWITEIELVDKTYEGFWQRKGWTNNGITSINSSIVIPGNQPINDRFPHLVGDNSNFSTGKNIPVAGIAFAGDRGISKVEVSIDGGNTWKTAVVKDPLSQYTWVLWTSGFTATDNGTYDIVVRATDKTGQVQTSKLEDPFPNGAEGYNRVNITV
jgi:DMSO/TMAO reductase YedYZ molybdopterin-dependent catalytic subunit